MENPWLNIQHHDYENHMLEVGQSQVLNKLTKYCLDKYQPARFALLGCTTGNGLEHVRPNITNETYAIDINKKYLEITKKKFQNKIDNLKILKIDIQKEELTIEDIELFFIGLVLEYVEPKSVLDKIIKATSKKGALLIVIQKNKSTSFVTKTKYKSLETLSSISKEVNEYKINKFICSKDMKLIKKEEIELTKNKSFIMLEYIKK